MNHADVLRRLLRLHALAIGFERLEVTYARAGLPLPREARVLAAHAQAQTRALGLAVSTEKARREHLRHYGGQ